jgi:hypothetical protein
MIGGIDQQIQQRVDAYRDNPQQLMQRYQQNQDHPPDHQATARS